MLALAGAYWFATSPWTLERACKARTPYIEQTGDAPAAQTLRAMVAVRDQLIALRDGLTEATRTSLYPPAADTANRILFPTGAWRTRANTSPASASSANHTTSPAMPT